MAGNAKEADLWFGRESARKARGKFKDLVCLVVFLCWIKRFCITFIEFKMQIYEKIFFKLSKIEGGDDPPQKNSRGGHVPPRPPRDRRLWSLQIYDWLSSFDKQSGLPFILTQQSIREK